MSDSVNLSEMEAEIEAIRARHKNSRQDWDHNPAAKNCHHDLGVVLEWVTFLDDVTHGDDEEISKLRSDLETARTDWASARWSFDQSDAENDRLLAQLEVLQKDVGRWQREALAWRNGCTGRHGSQVACVNVAATTASPSSPSSHKDTT